MHFLSEGQHWGTGIDLSRNLILGPPLQRMRDFRPGVRSTTDTGLKRFTVVLQNVERAKPSTNGTDAP